MAEATYGNISYHRLTNLGLSWKCADKLRTALKRRIETDKGCRLLHSGRKDGGVDGGPFVTTGVHLQRWVGLKTSMVKTSGIIMGVGCVMIISLRRCEVFFQATFTRIVCCMGLNRPVLKAYGQTDCLCSMFVL